MAQEKRPWWSISLWGGKKAPPASEPEASEHVAEQAPEAGAPPAAEPAPAPGQAPPAPQPQARAQDVSHAFDDLMGRYEALLGQTQGQGTGSASMAVVHRLLAEAEREAANLKARARRQAEVEAAPLLAEAKRQAQETIAQANREAQRITEQQVGTILDDAQRRAELIEERAKQAAQLFLMRCREDVQNFVAMEAKEAFYKLLAPVNEVLATAQEVESTWKMHAVDLWQSTAGQLEDYQNTLFGTLGTGTGVGAGEPLVGEPLGVPPASEPGTVDVGAAEGVLDETEVIAEHVVIVEDEEQKAAEPAVEAEAPPQAPEETAAVDGAAAVVAEAPTAGAEVVEAAPEPEAEEPQPKQPKAKGSRPARSKEPKVKGFTPVSAPEMYDGMLDLLIEPYTNVAKISKFYSELGSAAGIRLLQTSGSWDKGTVITIELNEPMSPEALIQRLPPDVQATPARMEEDGWWRSAMGRRAKGPGAHDAVAITFGPAPEADAHDHAADDGGETHDHDDADESAPADEKAEA